MLLKPFRISASGGSLAEEDLFVDSFTKVETSCAFLTQSSIMTIARMAINAGYAEELIHGSLLQKNHRSLLRKVVCIEQSKMNTHDKIELVRVSY